MDTLYNIEIFNSRDILEDARDIIRIMHGIESPENSI